ncbi:hypothetical protein QQ045_029555 [Rhodiola kirilowii]
MRCFLTGTQQWEKDRLFWRMTSSGEFSTKIYWEVKRDRQEEDVAFSGIWQSWIPSKISTFTWRLLHKVHPTDDKIQGIGFALPYKCSCCQFSQCETLEHLFFTGAEATRMWNFLAIAFHERRPLNMNQFK